MILTLYFLLKSVNQQQLEDLLITYYQIYDRSADSIKPSDTMSFVGILRFDANDRSVIRIYFVVLSQFFTVFSRNSPEKSESAASPVLHVLFTRPLQKTLLFSPYLLTEDAHTIRQDIIQWLASEALGGDAFTAEWVLLSCISSVYAFHHSHVTADTYIMAASPEDR